MPEELDKVQFGRLIESVERLTASVGKLTNDIENINARMNTGKGLAVGLIVASAGIGGSVGAFAHKILEMMK